MSLTVKPAIYNLDFPEIRERISAAREAQGLTALPRYRYSQLETALGQGLAAVEELSTWSRQDRAFLGEIFDFSLPEIVREQRSALDGSVKFGFRLQDGEHVEAVAMSYHHGWSLCVSSQVGCRMACRFCASGRAGLRRNLRRSELIGQLLQAQRRLGLRLSRIVLMGIGEPFENYETVLSFLRYIHAMEASGIGYRHMTISTCGLVPEILRFAEEGLPVNLAISLHAPSQELRLKLMPVARRYSLDELLAACWAYTERTGRRLTFEYAMIGGVNDGEAEARALAQLLKGRLCHVNLIPFNPFDEVDYQPSEGARIRAFQELLEAQGIACTRRRSLGKDIMGACGQLRRSIET